MGTILAAIILTYALIGFLFSTYLAGLLILRVTGKKPKPLHRKNRL